MPEIIAKHTVGQKATHNKDGKFTRTWRLWSDGRVERTDSQSKYQQKFASEKPPAEIIEAAETAGIEIKPGRKDWRSKPRKPVASQRKMAITIKLTPAEDEAIRANAAAAEKTIVDFVVGRCCRNC